MSKGNRAKAAETGEFLFRYMVARYRCIGGSLSSGRIRLVAEIKRGIQVFEGAIIVDAEARPPLINDREHYVFFAAMIGRYDGGLPDMHRRNWPSGEIMCSITVLNRKGVNRLQWVARCLPQAWRKGSMQSSDRCRTSVKWLLGRFPFAILAGGDVTLDNPTH